jgi:hypothetical protein
VGGGEVSPGGAGSPGIVSGPGVASGAGTSGAGLPGVSDSEAGAGAGAIAGAGSGDTGFVSLEQPARSPANKAATTNAVTGRGGVRETSLLEFIGTPQLIVTVRL